MVIQNWTKKNFLQNLNFNYLNDNQSDINSKFNKSLATLESIVEKHASLKKLTKKILNCKTNH